MDFSELVRHSRSVRRFDSGEKIPMSVLRSFVDNARLAPSPANLQPLRFVLVNREETGREIFQHATG